MVEPASTSKATLPIYQHWFRQSPLLWGGLFLLTLVLLLPRILAFGGHSWQALNYPYQLDYDEGFNLSAAWQWAHATNIYAPNTPAHFITAGYPPLYYLLNALILKIFGLSLSGGRFVSLSSSLLCGVLTGLLCHQFLSSALPVLSSRLRLGLAILVGLAWHALTPTYIWSTLYKQDMLGLALALAGFYFVERQVRSSWLALIPATVFLGLAVATKQNLLTALVAACLYTIVLNWQRGLRWLIILVVVVGVGWGGLTIYSKGGAYSHIILTQSDVGWSAANVMRLLLPLLRDHWLLVGLSLVCLVFVFYQMWRQKRLILPLAICYLFSCVGELATLGANGSNYNHALVFFPALLITAAGGFALLYKWCWQAPVQNWQKLGFWLASLFLVVGQIGFYVQPQAYSLAGDINAFNARAHQQTDQDIKRVAGPILSDDIELVLANGRPLPYDSLFHSSIAASKGHWDDSQLIKDIANRRFGMVLLGHDSDRLTPAAQIALQNSYKLALLNDLDEWIPLARPLQPSNPFKDCTLNTIAPSQPQIELQGYSFGLEPPQPGHTLTVTTYWAAVVPNLTNSYQLFIHVINSKGTVVAQRDATPANDRGITPTTTWQSSNTVQVDQSLPLPPSLPSGDYQVVVGAYSVVGSNIENLQPSTTCSNPINPFGQVVLTANLHF